MIICLQDSAKTLVLELLFDNECYLAGMERSKDGIDYYYDSNCVGTLS